MGIGRDEVKMNLICFCVDSPEQLIFCVSNVLNGTHTIESVIEDLAFAGFSALP